MKKIGINWNFAPVLDVNNNLENPVIGVRFFGETPEVVSEYGVKFMKGLQKAGVATSLKHFPGHGDTRVDSHHALPEIKHNLERLKKIELKLFKEAISCGADSVMTAHISFPALEPEKNLPATFSKIILTDLLREELAFDGVIVTDALEMEAISETWGILNGAVEAFKVGAVNLLIGHLPNEQMKAISRMVEAVENGGITKKRIEESLNRMNVLKENTLSGQILRRRKEQKKRVFTTKIKIY